MCDIKPFEITKIEEVDVGTKVYFYVPGMKGGFRIRSMTFWTDNNELDFTPTEGSILPEFHQGTPGYWDPLTVPKYMREIV